MMDGVVSAQSEAGYLQRRATDNIPDFRSPKGPRFDTKYISGAVRVVLIRCTDEGKSRESVKLVLWRRPALSLIHI